MNDLEAKGYVFGAIFALANKLQVLGDAFDSSITVKQWLFVVGVSKFSEPPTLSEVANHIGYSRQNAKRIALALQDKGFVEVRRDEKDARALRIAVTRQSQEYFAGRGPREVEFLNQLFTGFDMELIHAVCQGLAKLDGNIRELIDGDGL